MRLSLLSVLCLVACSTAGPEVWLVTHDAAAAETAGNCALSTRVEAWTEVAEVYLDDDTATVLLPGQELALWGTVEGGVIDVSYRIVETSADVQIDHETRYQLEPDAGQGIAVTSRMETRAGTDVEDCVRTVPLALSRLD